MQLRHPRQRRKGVGSMTGPNVMKGSAEAGVIRILRSISRRRQTTYLADPPPSGGARGLTLDSRAAGGGIAGPNGAGKSSMISLMLGFLHRIGSGQSRQSRVVCGVARGDPTGSDLPPRWKVPLKLRRLRAGRVPARGARPGSAGDGRSASKSTMPSRCVAVEGQLQRVGPPRRCW